MARTLLQSQDLTDSIITNPKLAVSSVDTPNIIDFAISANKVANDSISMVKLTAGAVGTTQIEDGSITSSKIFQIELNDGNIVDGSITGDKLAPGIYLDVLEQKKITNFIQINTYLVGAGLTVTEVTSVIGLTSVVPVSSNSLIEGVIIDEDKNFMPVRDSSTGEPILAYNSVLGMTDELFGRMTFGPIPGLTQWFVNFYIQPAGMTQFSTAIPNGTTMIDLQYLQRFNLGTVDESFGTSDKFFNGPVDMTEVLNINQLAKDVYTSPVLNNNGSPLLGTPLQTQIQNIVSGATPVVFNPAARSIPGIAIQLNAITEALLANNCIGITEIQDSVITTSKLVDASVTQEKIAFAAVGLTQIEPLSIITGLIRDQSVTGDKIVNSTILASKITTGQVVKSITTPATTLFDNITFVGGTNIEIDTIGQTIIIADPSAGFPSGTVLPFYQATPPVNWTQVVTHNDKAFRVVSGAGGGSGGSTGFSSGLNLSHTHNITVPSAGSHSHTVNSHSHTISHQHETALGLSGAQIFLPASSGPNSWPYGMISRSYNYWVQGLAGIAAATPIPYYQTSGSDTGSSGGSSPGTDTQGGHTHSATNDSQLGSYVFNYIDIILASRN